MDHIKNTIVLGEPGCGKTSCIAINETIEAIINGHSLFVNDNSKEEIYKHTYKLAKENDYSIICLDYLNYNGETFNCFDLIKYYYKHNQDVLCAELISLISETLINPLNYSEDPFWTMSANNYIKGIIYLILEMGNEDLNLENLAELCVDDYYLVQGMLSKKNTPMAYSLLEGVFSSSDKTTASILMVAFSSIVSLLSNPRLKEMNKTTSFNIKNMPQHKTIIYLKYPEYSEQYDGLVSLFIIELMHVLYHSCNEEGKLDIPFHFIIDEFAHFRLPCFERYISTSRSRNIQFTLLLQTVDQLNISYKESIAQIIMDCCQNIISFQTNNYKTMRLMSELSGYGDTIGNLPRISMNDLLNLRPFEAFCLIDHDPSIRLFTPYFMKGEAYE